MKPSGVCVGEKKRRREHHHEGDQHKKIELQQ